MTGPAAEQDAFLAFKARPGSDTLVELLRAHQGRIFRLCYQVLHDAHDAEDASQEVLLKIVEEIRQFADPESFRRWLNRVSLNAALEAARKAARRRAHETRAAMQIPVPQPLDAATRLSLFEAIAALDERSRDLVLEHYFEGESLESIGQREGCSAPAVCKKLDAARESLRRRLGASAAIPSLESLFPAAPAAPDLVTGAVLAKAKAAAAALAAGGTIMASKSSIVAGVATSVVLCIGLGAGLVLTLNSQPGEVDPKPVALNGTTSTAMPARETGAVKDAPGSDDRRATGIAKERIFKAFATHYPKLIVFNRVRKDKTQGMLLMQLIHNKDLAALAQSIVEDESGRSLAALQELYDSSKSDLHYFSLLLLVHTGRPELESFFLGAFSRGSEDPLGSSLAAFALGKIGSATALEALAAAIRSNLQAGGKPDGTLFYALSLSPGASLDHIVGICEELVRLGRWTPQEIRGLGYILPRDPQVIERLRLLADTHASAAVRMLALRPVIRSMKSTDDLTAFNARLRRENDPETRAEIIRMTTDSTLNGELEAMQPEAKRMLAETLSPELGSDQGLKMRVLLKLVPEDQMTLARDVLLGTPPAGVDAGKLDAVLFEFLPSVNSPEARRMMQEYALKMGVQDCQSPLVILAGIGPLTEERLIAPLIDLVQRADAGQKVGHLPSSIIALTGFSEELRSKILPQLETLYAATKRPEVRLAVLEGFARMGSAGQDLLVKEAGSSSDPACSLAAWSILNRHGAFERQPQLREGAKRFLQAWNPSPAEVPVTRASAFQASQYAELFAATYLGTGASEDLPALKRMAENPVLPGANANLLDSLRQSASAAIEMIELRAQLN